MRHPPGSGRRGAEQAPEALETPSRDSILDPWFCQIAAQHASAVAPNQTQAGTTGAAALPLREDLQNMLTSMARRVAWGGDRRKGSARIELSEGALAGATLVVHAEQRSVDVELELPGGTRGSAWEQRLVERLEARGFSARVRAG